MRLERFRVTNFRSVADSGDIEVVQRTVLVGRNESGKTNLLLALEALNPPGGRTPLVWVKDFPRDRRRNDFSEKLPVVATVWEFDVGERAELGRLFPRANAVTCVTVTRNYTTTLQVRFEDLPVLAVDKADLSERLRALRASVQASSRTLADASPVNAALNSLQQALTATSAR